MKYILKRDVSSDSARFEVLDELGAVCFRAVGRRNPSGEVVRLCRDSTTVAKIRDLNLSVLNTYSISTMSESARLYIAPSHGKLTVRFRGISFHIRGDILSGSYDILDADNTVVAAVTKRFSLGDTLLTTFNSQRELFCIAALICIESVAVNSAPALQTV